MNKNIIILIVALVVISFQSHACSMFVIKKNGKVMVGNNEDFWNQNSRMWFERGNKDEFGVAYVGFDDLWPQGAINDKGLVFDGFAMPHLEIKDFEGKDSPEHEDFLQFIMRTCSKVEEVKEIFLKWDLRGMETSMFYFVDKSGKQLIVEGDSLEIRNKSYDITSNFYPSQYDDLNDVTIKHYQKGRELIESKQDTSVSFCASLLDSLHQETSWGGGTLYSTLYDLNEGIIYLYFNHDFENVIKINVKDELAKGNHTLIIPELFPNNKKGQEFYNSYNNTLTKIELLGNKDIVTNSKEFSSLKNFLRQVPRINIFKENLDKSSAKWIENKDFKTAIIVYSFMIELFPIDSELYSNLGKSYLEIGKLDDALINYEKCIELSPDSKDIKKKIEAVKKLMN